MLRARSNSRRRPLTTLVVVALIATTIQVGASLASTPTSGTVDTSTPSLTWQGPDLDATTASESDADCTAPAALPDRPFPGYCDDFTLTVGVASSYWNSHAGDVTIDVTGGVPAEDYDLYVYDATGAEVGSSALPASLESVTLACPTTEAGPYHVRVVYFQAADDGVDATPGYDATATFSSEPGVCTGEPTGGPATFHENAIAFAPSTVVSASFLGAEPQVTIERRIPQTALGSIDPNRVFVDWPLSSRSGIGQLHRSLDGGDSFRLLFDRTCAFRSRPNCLTGGGGDTENEVNPVNGNLYFADQEVLANEALATSFDHGDSFVAQTAVTNTTTATDRQWVAVTDNTTTVGGKRIEALLTYHVPPTAYIQGIDSTGVPAVQPVPQLTNVAQSGQPRVDNNLNSPGHGWMYYPHAGFSPGGTWVATARVADYAGAAGWQDNQATGADVTSFPWIAIDTAGNAYVTWDNGGQIYYSYSRITDRSNDPGAGGRPGTTWSPAVKVNLPSVGSAVLPEVTAGDAGRIAITYVGTTEFSGIPDNAPDATRWNVYAAVLPDALSATPTVESGVVSHRFMHLGNVCTGGTGCTTNPAADRSLLDMIDLSFDEAGRVGVIFMDNYSTFQDIPGSEDDPPFVQFAKQTSGPSVLANVGTVNVSVPTGGRSDAGGDATWPNIAGTANLPALDLRGASVTLESGQVVARLQLADASTAGMIRDLAAYNIANGSCLPATSCTADRLQYVARFATGTEFYHLSMDVSATGAPRFFGGKLGANDKIVAEASPSTTFAASYKADAGFPVTGVIQGDTIVLRAPAAAFGLAAGESVYSAAGYAMAGPSETTEITIGRIMRTVDATPPFDATLAEADLSIRLTDAPDPVKSGSNLTYTVVVSNAGPSTASGVSTTQNLPANASFKSVTSSLGACTRTGTTVRCTIGDLGSGELATINVVVRPGQKGTITSTASVASTSPADNQTANNTSTATTVVGP
jgi:uncharacterized repeat protein (TIGR01451 family)